MSGFVTRCRIQPIRTCKKDPRAKQIYARLRRKGNTHARGLRGVGDRLLELICVLLRSDQLYQLDRRQPKQDAA